MATINWGNASIRVHEIPRGAALDAYRELDLIAGSWLLAGADMVTINREIELLIAVYSPVSVVLSDEANGKTIQSSGVVTIKLFDETECKLLLPLTRDGFNELPLSVAKLWIEAAATVNQTFLDDLKKALDRMTEQARLKSSDSSSGDVPSPAPTPEPQTIPMTGT